MSRLHADSKPRLRVIAREGTVLPMRTMAGTTRRPNPASIPVRQKAGRDDADLPNLVSIAPNRTFSQGAQGPGFFGPRYAPLIVGRAVHR
jgi:hypothetical protein